MEENYKELTKQFNENNLLTKELNVLIQWAENHKLDYQYFLKVLDDDIILNSIISKLQKTTNDKEMNSILLEEIPYCRVLNDIKYLKQEELEEGYDNRNLITNKTIFARMVLIQDKIVSGKELNSLYKNSLEYIIPYSIVLRNEMANNGINDEVLMRERILNGKEDDNISILKDKYKNHRTYQHNKNNTFNPYQELREQLNLTEGFSLVIDQVESINLDFKYFNKILNHPLIISNIHNGLQILEQVGKVNKESVNQLLTTEIPYLKIMDDINELNNEQKVLGLDNKDFILYRTIFARLLLIQDEVVDKNALYSLYNEKRDNIIRYAGNLQKEFIAKGTVGKDIASEITNGILDESIKKIQSRVANIQQVKNVIDTANQVIQISGNKRVVTQIEDDGNNTVTIHNRGQTVRSFGNGNTIIQIK